MTSPVIIYGNNIQITADAMQSASGFPTIWDEVVEEKLTANGVDGARWRTVFSQFTEDTWTTVEGCASFAAAVERAQTYKALKGQLVRVSAAIGGVSYQWKNVHISGVVPMPTPGPVTGAGVSSGMNAHLRAVWTVEFTDFDA